MHTKTAAINATVAIPIVDETVDLKPALRTCISCGVPEVILCDSVNAIDSAAWYQKDKDTAALLKQLDSRITKTAETPQSLRSRHPTLWLLRAECHVGKRAAKRMIRYIASKRLPEVAHLPVKKVEKCGFLGLFLFFYFLTEWWYMWKRNYSIHYLRNMDCRMQLLRTKKDGPNPKKPSAARKSSIMSLLFGGVSSEGPVWMKYMVSSEVWVRCESAWSEFRKSVYELSSSEGVGILHWLWCILYFILILPAAPRTLLFQWESMSPGGFRVALFLWCINSLHMYVLASRYFIGMPVLAIVVLHPILGPIFCAVYIWAYVFAGPPDDEYEDGGENLIRKNKRKPITVKNRDEEETTGEEDDAT